MIIRESKFKKALMLFFLMVFFVEANASLVETANFGSYGFPAVKKMPNGMGYAVGGNYFMKLNTHNLDKPLLSLTPPSITLGCNGLSIKGMFMSILGLDDLQALLSNSGATVAWGIMLGLIETLPSVSQTFAQIREFVRRLQALLSQGCAIGKKIGEKIAKETVGDKINVAMGKFNTADHSLAQKIKNWRGDPNSMFGGLLSSSSVPDSTKQNMIVGVVLDGFSPAHGTWGKYIYSYAHSHGKDIDSFINQISSGGSSVKAGDYSYTVTNINPLPYSGMNPDFKLQAGLIILLQNYGMLDTNVLISNQIPVFTQMAANLAKALGSSDPNKAKVALSEEMKVFSSEKKSKADAVVQRYFSRNADSKDLSQLASFFQDGTNKLKKIAVPEFVSLQVKKGSSIVTSILAPVDKNEIETSGGWIDYINTFGDTDNIARAQVACLTAGSQSSVPIDTNTTIKTAGKTKTVYSTKHYIKALKGLRNQLTLKLEKLHSVGPYGSFNQYLNTLDQRNKQNALRNIGQ